MIFLAGKKKEKKKKREREREREREIFASARVLVETTDDSLCALFSFLSQ